MRKLLVSTSDHQHQDFSDGAIRGFLLGQLSAREQSAFEAALFTNPQLEQRARLVEIELVDDYAADRFKANERTAFQQKFLVTAARQKKLEVSAALHRSLAGLPSQPTASSQNSLFSWRPLALRIAFALVALIVLFASALVILREPQLVKRIIPKRFRPVALATPTAEPAHHRTNSSESPTHRDESPSLPAHEAAPQMILLRLGVTSDNAPVFSRTQDGSKVVRLELKMERTESATFSIVVTTSSGEVVHNVPEIHVDASDRIDFDILIERLKPGDFQVTLTRLSEPDGVGTFYFRVQ